MEQNSYEGDIDRRGIFGQKNSFESHKLHRNCAFALEIMSYSSTDSDHINIITNAIRTDFTQQMQLFDVFIPFFFSLPIRNFPHFSQFFSFSSRFFSLNDSQSNQQIMCPTSSHRKTQIPHIFCTEKNMVQYLVLIEWRNRRKKTTHNNDGSFEAAFKIDTREREREIRVEKAVLK